MGAFDKIKKAASLIGDAAKDVADSAKETVSEAVDNIQEKLEKDKIVYEVSSDGKVIFKGDIDDFVRFIEIYANVTIVRKEETDE